MNIGTYISSSISEGIRSIKAYVFGSSDVREADQINPAGIDSCGIKGMKPVFAKTANNSQPVCIGWIMESEVNDGEIKLYSFNESGKLGEVYCKDNGDVQINNGIDFATKFDALKNDIAVFNGLLTTELGLIATGIVDAGGVYTPTGLSLDINNTTKADKLRI